MESIQINGQKIWGPPSDWVGPPPPHGTEVYVRNIPDDVSGHELCNIFSTVGKIYQLRLPVQWNGVNKGFGFVRFTNVSEADEAIEKLHMCPIRHGRQITVERSFDNTRLYLSGVPKEKSGEEIKKDLLTVVDNVKTVYAYPAAENPSLYRGYAFAEFVCHRDAAVAKRILTQDVLFNLFEKKCNTSWAKPLPFLNKDDLKQVKILFMRNLPQDIKTVTVRMAINFVIAPDSVQRVKRNKDYAFLTFDDHETAKRALNKIKANPYIFGPKEIQMEWAIPRNSSTFSSKGSLTDDDEQMELNSIRNNSRENYPRSKYSDEAGTDESFSLEDHQNMNTQYTNNYSSPSKDYFPKPQPFDNYGTNRISQDQSNKGYDNLMSQLQGLQIKRSITKGNNFTNASYSSDCDKSSLYNFPSNSNDYTLPITEYRVPHSEEYNRQIRLNCWLQSLSQQEQPSSPTSPVDFSKIFNWKWNGYRQFPSGQPVLGL